MNRMVYPEDFFSFVRHDSASAHVSAKTTLFMAKMTEITDLSLFKSKISRSIMDLATWNFA